MSIQGPAAAKEMGVKWELAQRLTATSQAPKQALESLFKGIIQNVESKRLVSLDPDLKKQIWNKASPERLKRLENHFLSIFCNKILGDFKENEVEEMLKNHKSQGSIGKNELSTRLGKTYLLHNQEVLNSVVNQAFSMNDKFTEEVMESLRSKGVTIKA